MKLISCLLVTLLTCAGVSGAQTSTSQAQQENQPARHARRQPSDLATRSEMQQPKPIPIVNPLRFPEIPVTACSDGARFATANEASSQVANPSQNPAPRSADCVALPNETQWFLK